MFKKAIASFSIICVLSLSAEPAKTAAVKSAAPAKTEAAKSAATSAKVETAAPGVDSSDPKVVAKTMVYIKSGSRYHMKGCQYLKNKGTAITVGDAIKQGYAPCNVCHAPKLKRGEG